MKKRGSHIGVIISFVLFATFLFFLYAALRPTIINKSSNEQFLSSSEETLISNFSQNLTTLSLRISDDFSLGGKDCLEINGLNQITDLNINENNIFVKISNGDERGYDLSLVSDSLAIENDDSTKFFNIFASSAIDSSESSFLNCKEVDLSDYKIGVIKSEKVIFEQNILKAIQAYQTDYSGFKNNIGIPDDKEIGFSFIYSNSTLISTEEESPETNVYAMEFPINYFDSRLSIQAGKLVIRTW